MSGRLSS